ncbi:hypothetical protein OCU04_007924 [Sclerotinia nivalis]|uniref:Uncharacterized protein n=1 Tax=Sclerotinia nivalis TaxID=352851 RepID=A0A9X0AKP3_9HELO|nr:hypothetical protein OCU04_007924 [Sclerotinia nivalis]
MLYSCALLLVDDIEEASSSFGNNLTRAICRALRQGQDEGTRTNSKPRFSPASFRRSWQGKSFTERLTKPTESGSAITSDQLATQLAAVSLGLSTLGR